MAGDQADSRRPADGQPPTSPLDGGNDAGLQAAQVVFDVVTGPNWRFRDNLYQAIAILAAMTIGIVIGLIVSPQAVPEGMVVGGAIGLLCGLMGSGIVIGVLRFITSFRSRRD